MSERDDSDIEPSEEERAEAAALARALAGGEQPEGAPGPEDARAAAALLRAAAAPAPDAARLARAAGRAREALAARPPSRRRWLLPAALLAPATAAAVALLVLRSPAHAPVPALPRPSAALLEAQARAARGGADLTTLDAEMRDYRAAYYAALAGDEP